MLLRCILCVDPALVTALTLNPVTSPVPMGQTITTVTFTCATTGCQGEGTYMKAAWAPTGQCGTAAKREMTMLVTTAAKSVPNVVLLSNQVYKLCWCVDSTKPCLCPVASLGASCDLLLGDACVSLWPWLLLVFMGGWNVQ
jgi:hypothetical protein